MAYTFCDFAMGKVVIDFRDWTMEELKRLGLLCHLINPDRTTPAFRFSDSYYVNPDHCAWYEGGSVRLYGSKPTCRATEITLPWEGEA